MNAPNLSRREFAAALGGIVLSFSLLPRLALGQQAQLPGSLGGNRMLDAKPRPSETEVREALAGNLCRCGTHGRIIKAVLRASNEAGRT